MRNVVIGASSKIWRALAADPRFGTWTAIGHKAMGAFDFLPGDCVWLLSYSRDARENAAMIDAVAASRASCLVYVSSSSAVVAQTSGCYEYPRAKAQAQAHALGCSRAKILILGLVYEHESELPGGLNMAVSLERLAHFLLQPQWPDGAGRARHLLFPVRRPFTSRVEAWAHRAYGTAIRLVGPWPCLLRPVDLVLRLLGWHWYGYTFLSNRKWSMTTSS